MANIPPGWKQILDQAKVQKHELQDPVVSQAIINTAVASVPPKPPARKPSLGAPAHVLPDLDHVVFDEVSSFNYIYISLMKLLFLV